MSDLGQQLRRIARYVDDRSASDGELLERFFSAGEQAAFELLVRRHGAMVFGLCRRTLNDYHQAEDAFQATFLVLVRKATSIRKRESIASWLCRVAFRTAAKARSLQARRRSRERPMFDMPQREWDSVSLDGLHPILDSEINRLSEIYRAPVVLCDLEGKTRKEAARLVGCPEGTLSTRLMRARTLLARRLRRQGVALSAGALGLALSQYGASAAPASSLVLATTRAACAVPAGQAAGIVSTQVVGLTKAVLRSMFWIHSMKAAGIVVVTGVVCAAATSYMLSREAPAAESPDTRSTVARTSPRTALHKLMQRTTLERGFDTNTMLGDALDSLRDRYDLTIDIDPQKSDLPVHLPALFHVRVSTLFRLLAEQIKGVCLVNPEGKVVIIPDDENILKPLLANGHAPIPPAAINEKEQSDVFAVATKAYRRAQRQLRSGSGSGVFEVYARPENEKDPRLKKCASFTLHFDHRRYYIKLKFEQHEEKVVRQIIICDNSAVYTSIVSIVPMGIDPHWAGVYDLPDGHARAGILWNPSQIFLPPLDVGSWINNAGEDVHVEELAKGGYRIRARKDDAETTCTILKQFDWNVAEWTSHSSSKTGPQQDVLATWKKAGDIWYVAELERRGGRGYRSIVRLKEFTANPAIPSKLFRLAALELPNGATIYDNRPHPRHESYTYRVIPDDGPRRFFDMEAELESMPVP